MSTQAKKKSTPAAAEATAVTMPKGKKAAAATPAAVVETPAVETTSTVKVDKKIVKYDTAAQVLMDELTKHGITVPERFFRLVPSVSRHSSKPKDRDANAPKKAQTAYNFFCNDKYEEARTKAAAEGKDKPDMPAFSDIAKIWKSFTEAQRLPYKARQDADKARFTAEKALYDAAHPKVEVPKVKKSRKATPAPAEIAAAAPVAAEKPKKASRKSAAATAEVAA